MSSHGKIRRKRNPSWFSRDARAAGALGLLLVILSASRAWAQWPIGNDALRLVEDWPLYREGVVCQQISSADPEGGDNDGIGYLYQQDSLYVIFDQDGPGCVYRIWIRNTASAPSRTIKFYFDNEIFPSISVLVANLFSGLYQNFQWPLVGDGSVSSGGNYCYLPLPFAHHLKIAIVDVVLPYQIDYQVYPANTPVQTFTTSQTPDSVIAQWQNTGSDPKDTVGNLSASGAVVLQPNQTQTLFWRTGGGSIAGIRLTPSPTTLSVLEGVRLRCYWDDSVSPQVDCTIGSFFGSSLGLAQVDGLPIGMDGNQFYCYIPMPFWASARVDLYNPLVATAVNVGYEITYKTGLYPAEATYFCTAQNWLQTALQGQDMILANLSGHGHLAGMVVTLMSSTYPGFLHGDLRIYADGIAHPLMQGTDFDGDFNAGNYYTSNAFSLPVHGAPALQMGAGQKKICAYRFLLGDLIPFATHLNLRAEHGNLNSEPLEYAAVLYSFRRPEIALVLSDNLDVGNQAEEQAHNYLIQGAQISQTHYYAYPGSYDNQYFSDQGRTHFGISSFNVAVDPENRGVRLVRRRDASIFPQSALVSVNGDSVGVWWDGDYNNYKRWGESVFEVPESLTQGLSQIQISVAYRSGAGWSEYRYWVYSHVPPRLDTTLPSQVANVGLVAPENGSKMNLHWDLAEDDVGVGSYRVYRSDVPGVEPADSMLIAEIPLTNFTDANLTPGTWYYYRISAVDYSGNEGPASSEASQRTSSTYLFECERMPISGISQGDSGMVQNMVNYGENWSNQEQLLFMADETGDFIRLNLAIAAADTYDVAAYFGKGPNQGIVNLQIDSEPLGLPSDLYSPTVQRSPRIEFGSFYLTAGAHRVTFEVAGKNAASTNYWIGADDILFTSHYLLGVPPIGNPSAPFIFQLHQNYPNPFNAVTRLQFSLPEPGWTTLWVYDLCGRRVSSLEDGWMSAGNHNVIWNAEPLSSGIYFLALRQGERQAIRKLLLLK